MRQVRRSLVAALCVLGVASLQSSFAATTIKLTNSQDKLSYSMGVMTGKAFRAQHVDVNPAAFAAGLTAGITGQKSLLSDKEINTILKDYQKKTFAKLQKKMQVMADKNEKLGAAFLAANKKKSGVKQTASGLQYKVLKPGTGAKPTKTDVVVVDYEGKLIGGKVFDSSYKRGKPAMFRVDQVIPGWTEALQMMKVGATWELFIPAKLAYGKMGAPGTIGPNETLIFKVHLRSIKKS